MVTSKFRCKSSRAHARNGRSDNAMGPNCTSLCILIGQDCLAFDARKKKDGKRRERERVDGFYFKHLESRNPLTLLSRGASAVAGLGRYNIRVPTSFISKRIYCRNR